MVQSAWKEKTGTVNVRTQAIDDDFTGRSNRAAVEPPTWDEDDLQVRVDLIVGHLERAAEGIQTAWEVSHALLALANRRGTISPEQRDKLARQLIIFVVVAEHVLPNDIPRDRIAPGLAAAFKQICFWSMPPEERQSVDHADRLDIGNYARRLRNSCHDSCLLADIQARGKTFLTRRRRQIRAQKRGSARND